MSLHDRIALVTGGSRGIGRAIALALAEDGADVALSYRRDEAAAAETVSSIEGLGRRASAYAASMDHRPDLEALAKNVATDLGTPTILVHNAGIASRGQTVEETDPTELERVMAVHALGPHHLSKLLIPGMRGRERADIVFVSSVATLAYAARGAPYSMAKAAMEALAYTLARELQGDGVRVNVVAPGLVETEMGRRLVRARQGIEDLRELDAAMPFGRVCQPEEVAGVVRFLVSEGAAYVSGQKINVHGGGS